MSRLGVLLLVVLLLVVGYAVYRLGLVSRLLYIASSSDRLYTTTGNDNLYTASSSNKLYITTGNDSDGVARYRDAVFSVASYVDSVFRWLLGDSLSEAIVRLVTVLLVLGVVYAISKLIKFIAIVVVCADAVLIVLKYVFGVI
jgi:hypothetical protein